MNPARRHELELRLACAIDRNVETGLPARLLARAVIDLVIERSPEECTAIAIEVVELAERHPRKWPG